MGLFTVFIVRKASSWAVTQLELSVKKISGPVLWRAQVKSLWPLSVFDIGCTLGLYLVLIASFKLEFIDPIYTGMRILRCSDGVNTMVCDEESIVVGLLNKTIEVYDRASLNKVITWFARDEDNTFIMQLWACMAWSEDQESDGHKML